MFAKTRQEVGVGDDGVDRARVIQLMRVWQRWSAVVGGDVSWDVSNQLGKYMRAVPLDLKDSASILLGPARAQRMVKAQEELLAMTTLADEVRASDDYRTLAQAQDEATAMYVSLLDGDRIVQVTNAAFDRLLESGGDMGSRVLLHRTTPVLLPGQLVAPDDREAFYEGYMPFFVPSRQEKSIYFLKWFTGDEEIKLCIVSFRSVQVGHRHGLQMLVEMAPDSRHLTTQPHRNQVINTFRASSPSSSASIGLKRPSSSSSPSQKPPLPRVPLAGGRQTGEAWGATAGRSRQGAWRRGTFVGEAGVEADASTAEGGGMGGGGGGAGEGGGEESTGGGGGEGIAAEAFPFSGLACLTLGNALPTDEGLMRGLLRVDVERQSLLTTGLAPKSLLLASGQDWHLCGEGARGKLGRMEELRRRREGGGAGSGGTTTVTSSKGSSKSSGMVEEGDEELDAVLASVVGPMLDDEEMSRVFGDDD